MATGIGYASAQGNFSAAVVTPTAVVATPLSPLDIATDSLAAGCRLYSFAIYTLFVGGMVLAGTLGNLLSFRVFRADPMKTSAGFLFQALSCVDTLVLLMVFPLYCITPFVEYTGYFSGFKFVYPYILVYVLPFAFTAQTSTIWVTVLVAVNRYIAVCRPFSAARLCTVAKAKKQFIIVLTMSLLYNAPKFFEYKVDYQMNEDNTAMEPVPGYRVLGKINLYYIIYGNAFYLVFLLLMPIVILSALNARLITSLKALKRKRADMQSLRQQQDNNVTFVLIVVVLVFIVCQVPATVNQVLWNIVSDDSRVCGGFHFYLRHIANALVILNSSVNFAIYTAFNTRFRRVLVREVCPRRIRACLRRLSPAHSTTATAAADEPTFTATVNRATPVSRVTPDRAVADIPLAGETTSDFAAPASNVENGVKDTLL